MGSQAGEEGERHRDGRKERSENRGWSAPGCWFVARVGSVIRTCVDMDRSRRRMLLGGSAGKRKVSKALKIMWS